MRIVAWWIVLCVSPVVAFWISFLIHRLARQRFEVPMARWIPTAAMLVGLVFVAVETRAAIRSMSLLHGFLSVAGYFVASFGIWEYVHAKRKSIEALQERRHDEQEL